MPGFVRAAPVKSPVGKPGDKDTAVASDEPSLDLSEGGKRRVPRPQSSTPQHRSREALDAATEHAALRRQFDELETALSSENTPATVIRDLVGKLVLKLDVHFSAEEDFNGVFEQIQRDAPHFAQEVRQLRAEHVDLLESARQLFVIARDGDDGRYWPQQVRHLFHRLRERLIVHETGENRLLQRTYGEDVGAED
jgi:hypothetical protein